MGQLIRRNQDPRSAPPKSALMFEFPFNLINNNEQWRGRGEKEFPSPPLRFSIFFKCSCSNFHKEIQLETLATQAMASMPKYGEYMYSDLNTQLGA